MSKRLIIFAREPVAGQVKTRLAADIGAEQAAAVYDEMLREVLAGVASLSDVTITAYWAAAEETVPELADRYAVSSRCQVPGALGERMHAAFADQLSAESLPCCIIGSDAPDLPEHYLQQAFAALTHDDADVVFGPSEDGGYYLLGMKRLWPELFHGIDWSTPQVLKQSLAAADRAGARVELLPEWQDIDTYADLLAYQERVRLKGKAP